MRKFSSFVFAAALAPALLSAEPPPAPTVGAPVEETIQVTATRIPEDVLDVPADVEVVTAAELEARGATTLAEALALVGGVAIAPGGDGGPASSVPEMMGLREFDAFLLVVDDVPWGGAYNPALVTLDLTNLDRIEVLRGAAPVLYGATSFVGVIHVIHRKPADTTGTVNVWGGSHDTFGGNVTWGGKMGSFAQSIAAGYDDQGFEDDRTGYERAHVLWSGRGKAGPGELGFAADFTMVDQEPASPHPRQGRVLSPLVPIDANHNPSDAKIDEERIHLTADYRMPITNGEWVSKVAISKTDKDTVRGFLAPEFVTPAGVPNANGFTQEFEGEDLYLDSHVTWRPNDELSIVAGADLLSGKGEAESVNFRYRVNLDGSRAPSSSGQTVVERPEFEDERLFLGGYALALWKPTDRWLIDAGLRMNHTKEEQEGEVETEHGEEQVTSERDDSRLSGALGASFRLMGETSNAVWLFARYTDAFKPAALDFGPEAEGTILDPETATTIEGGFKGSHLDGRLTWQASAYTMDFENLVIAATVDGLPVLRNGGEQRFEGFELESKLRVGDAWTFQGSYASHSAKFRDFVQEFDGVPTQLSGKKLEMSPEELASLGVLWAPERGFFAHAEMNYTGDRFLNKRNTAPADPFTTYGAGIGFRFERWTIRLDGENLTDERDPVAESELGDAQYYLLPARAYRATASFHFGK